MDYCQATGKLVFFSAFKAHKNAKRIRKRRGGLVKVYRCGFCQLWHTGSTRGRDDTFRLP